jgi:hypothetical protein
MQEKERKKAEKHRRCNKEKNINREQKQAFKMTCKLNVE